MDKLESIEGIGPKTANLLNKLGITNINDFGNRSSKWN